ncbi:deoxyhypusine hydroxylase [Onthophagus taurus]|uniref:deoxyhypusine hydroxylase n=1 Tax=Onthophagus taurus TaxID=166361 RepID=UPI000C209666|nr:deoxyhypusine hydroxylase [Onthophagus taurus]
MYKNLKNEQIESIGGVLNDKNRPLKERFRALFTLKSIGGETAIKSIEKCFSDDSALLKHELAYCLGQMQDERALRVLINVLKDKKQEAMVRHEAAEGIGAIGKTDSLPILEEYINDKSIEVVETCQLAIKRIKYLSSEKIPSTKSEFNSIDPTPSFNNKNEKIDDLRRILLDPNEDLFERYQAMFSLRNLNSDDSIKVLCEGLNCDGALFKHEIAFVLGQLRHPKSIEALTKSLRDESENEMVRHECAEALGSIADEECFAVLKDYLNDSKRVVKESCIIALDMCEYENSPEFQYANFLD